jgi:hypothetical protein
MPVKPSLRTPQAKIGECAPVLLLSQRGRGHGVLESASDSLDRENEQHAYGHDQRVE